MKLAPGPLGERLHSYRVEDVLCNAQLCSCVGAAALAEQPFPIEQMGAREFRAHPRAAKPLDTKRPLSASGARRSIRSIAYE